MDAQERLAEAETGRLFDTTLLRLVKYDDQAEAEETADDRGPRTEMRDEG